MYVYIYIYMYICLVLFFPQAGDRRGRRRRLRRQGRQTATTVITDYGHSHVLASGSARTAEGKRVGHILR